MLINEMSPAKARIVAHICGDGYTYCGKRKRSQKELKQHPRKNIFRTRKGIIYVNTDQQLIASFRNDIKSIYGREVVSRGRHEYEVAGVRIHDEITTLGAGKSKDWFIHKLVFSSDNNTRSAWLQAFFDDEAHISTTQNRIVLNLVNEKGLKQVKKLLETFNIESILRGPYKCREFFTYQLCIYKDNVLKFERLIGSQHPKKKERLEIIRKKKSGGTGTFGTSTKHRPRRSNPDRPVSPLENHQP